MLLKQEGSDVRLRVRSTYAALSPPPHPPSLYLSPSLSPISPWCTIAQYLADNLKVKHVKHTNNNNNSMIYLCLLLEYLPV